MRRAVSSVLAVAVLTLGNACVFVAREVRTEVVVGQVEDAESIPGRAGSPELTLHALDRTIEVVTVRPRTCTRVTYDLVEVSITKRLGADTWPEFLDAMEGLAETYVFAPLAIVGLAVAGAAGVVSLPIAVGDLLVSNHSPDRTRVRRATGTVSFSCPLPIAAKVRIDTPSGAALSIDTDASGRRKIELPEIEPPSGVVHASLGARRAHVRYFQDRASCVTARDVYFASISGAPPELRPAMVPELPACGKLTSGGPGDGSLEEAWELTGRAIADAHAGHCNRVLAADGAVADRDRAHHENVFTSQPDIAACLARGLVRAQIATAVRERVQRCAPLLPGGGTIRANLSIDPRGKVTSATITGGGSELAACVQQVMTTASFPATELGGTTSMLVDLRPLP